MVVTGEAAAFNVTYKFGVGGGWTHQFKVLYRKKGGNNDINNNNYDNDNDIVSDNNSDNDNDSTILSTKETFPTGSC